MGVQKPGTKTIVHEQPKRKVGRPRKIKTAGWQDPTFYPASKPVSTPSEKATEVTVKLRGTDTLLMVVRKVQKALGAK